MSDETDRIQESNDRLYWKIGPCCAGCDHWETPGGHYGECKKSAPMSGFERYQGVGMKPIGWVPPAGHALTERNHSCGEFEDSFEWSSLSLVYRKRIGCPVR